MIEEDPTKSMRRMSDDLNISTWTINETINKDLRCKSYRMQTGQLLTKATKGRRVLECTRMNDPENGVFDFIPFSHWSPSSPDCNPCDYFFCSYLETMTNRTSHNIKASLIVAIEAGIRDIPAARLKIACARFRSRQEQLLAANDGYFE